MSCKYLMVRLPQVPPPRSRRHSPPCLCLPSARYLHHVQSFQETHFIPSWLREFVLKPPPCVPGSLPAATFATPGYETRRAARLAASVLFYAPQVPGISCIPSRRVRLKKPHLRTPLTCLTNKLQQIRNDHGLAPISSRQGLKNPPRRIEEMMRTVQELSQGENAAHRSARGQARCMHACMHAHNKSSSSTQKTRSTRAPTSKHIVVDPRDRRAPSTQIVYTQPRAEFRASSQSCPTTASWPPYQPMRCYALLLAEISFTQPELLFVPISQLAYSVLLSDGRRDEVQPGR